jgi:uncharacterized protein YkwD/uncharacterized membrane protein required for colicin V production
MNLVDVLLAFVVLLSILAGWRRGLLAAGSDLLALLTSLALAFFGYPHVVRFAEAQGLVTGVWAAPLAFVITYLLTRLVLGFALAALLRRLPAKTRGHGANRALGAVPGAANGLINATVVSMLLLAPPWSEGVSRAARDSALANAFAGPAQSLEAVLRPIFDPAWDRTLQRLTVRPGSNALVRLPFVVNEPRRRPDLEADMLRLLNQERRAHGLGPLRADAEAAEVAAAHSRDMFVRAYFSHLTPDGQDPFERMQRAGLRFFSAGENLALARTLALAHQGLMHSPGHRANILRPGFSRVGIGIVDGGRYGLMVTQNFRN